MLPLPVDLQGRRLVERHPSFQPVVLTNWFGVWEGALRPAMQTYRVQVRYFMCDPFKSCALRHPYVEVFVLDPTIGSDPRGTGEPPPHVYRVGYPAERPALCLFDPAAQEWSPSAHIAETIVPWTIEWLLWFELWVWDGVWRGGGRHPGEPVAPARGTSGPRQTGHVGDGGLAFHPNRKTGSQMGGVASSLAIMGVLGEPGEVIRSALGGHSGGATDPASEFADRSWSTATRTRCSSMGLAAE